MSYPIDEQNLERQRLLARVLEPITKRLLNGLRLRSDSRCLDIGGGIVYDALGNVIETRDHKGDFKEW